MAKARTSAGPNVAALKARITEIEGYLTNAHNETSSARQLLGGAQKDAMAARNETQATLNSMHELRKIAGSWKAVAEQERREITALRFDLALAGASQSLSGESEGVRPVR